MFEVGEAKKQKAIIKVMGVGGCGGNAGGAQRAALL